MTLQFIDVTDFHNHREIAKFSGNESQVPRKDELVFQHGVDAYEVKRVEWELPTETRAMTARIFVHLVCRECSRPMWEKTGLCAACLPAQHPEGP